MGFVLEDKKLKRAGLDYWPYLDVRIYESSEEFFAAHPDAQFYYFTTKGEQVYSDVVYPDNAFLIFGREDAGLPEELLLAHRERCVRLPMGTGIRSLNLSNTVAIGVYEVLRQWGFPELQNKGQLTKYRWGESLPTE